MARIVGVHGIAQQYKGSEILMTQWEPSLRDGVSLAGGATLPEGTLACAAYGCIFRPKGNVRAANGEHFRASGLTDDEAELLSILLEEAAHAEPDRIRLHGVQLRASTPGSVQSALR